MKKQTPKKETFFCTPQQRHAALRFVERTIQIQKIIGPRQCGSGEHDILQQINGEYQASVDALLHEQKRTGYLDERAPVCTLILSNERPGFILRSEDILSNGSLSEQASATQDYWFAVNGRNAVAYEVRRAGKAKFALMVYYNMAGDDEISSLWQVIDAYSGPSGTAMLRCPCCERDVEELFVSCYSCKFGCVECITILDPREAAFYERTLKAATKKGRVA